MPLREWLAKQGACARSEPLWAAHADRPVADVRAEWGVKMACELARADGAGPRCGAVAWLSSRWGHVLRDSDLSGADLSGADLRRASLRAADVFDADLRCANIIDADLRGADLRCAMLSGAMLWAADLRRADLRDAYLDDANLVAARRSPHDHPIPGWSVVDGRLRRDS